MLKTINKTASFLRGQAMVRAFVFPLISPPSCLGKSWHSGLWPTLSTVAFFCLLNFVLASFDTYFVRILQYGNWLSYLVSLFPSSTEYIIQPPLMCNQHKKNVKRSFSVLPNILVYVNNFIYRVHCVRLFCCRIENIEIRRVRYIKWLSVGLLMPFVKITSSS